MHSSLRAALLSRPKSVRNHMHTLTILDPCVLILLPLATVHKVMYRKLYWDNGHIYWFFWNIVGLYKLSLTNILTNPHSRKDRAMWHKHLSCSFLFIFIWECSSRFLDDFCPVIYPAIESCYNLIGSLLGFLRHALYRQFSISSLNS